MGTEEQRTRDLGQGRGDRVREELVGRALRGWSPQSVWLAPLAWPSHPSHTDASLVSVYSEEFSVILSSAITRPPIPFPSFARRPTAVGVFPSITCPSVLSAF